MNVDNMTTYKGTIVSGTGNMSKRMAADSIALAVYEKESGQTLVPGSLNIKLDHAIDMPKTSRLITRNDTEGEAHIYITPAFVCGIPGFAVRNKIAEEGHGRHAKDIIEIISAHKLRDELQLTDGDTVEVRF